MFRIFWQVWIGEIGKKDYHNAKRIKKPIVNDGIYEEFWISNVYFFKKHSMILQNSLIKSLIHKIKKIKISRMFWQLKIDKIENKMSKIIRKIKK